MLVGQTPFYTESLAGTYSNIMNFKHSLRFPDEVDADEIVLSPNAKVCSFSTHFAC
jgi:hypothetical protein